MGFISDVLDESLTVDEMLKKDRRFVTENDEWTLYRTSATDGMQKDLDEYTDSGICIGDYYTVLEGERKSDGFRAFFVFEKKTGRPVLDASSYHEFSYKKFILETWIKDDTNIVNMARIRCGKKE